MTKIKQMLQMQQQLNDATGGVGWEHGHTDKGKLIDWKRCIYLEAAELVDSYPWKHWKNIDATPDYDNIKIEIVDIWHFVMSEALRNYKIGKKGGVEALYKAILTLPNYKQFVKDVKPLNDDIYAQIALVESFIKTLFVSDDILKLIDAFFIMSYELQVNQDILYRLYIGKNILNQFRQDHGYKEGKYVKEWNGVEDNVVMQDVLEKQPDVTPKELYKALERVYAEVEDA